MLGDTVVIGINSRKFDLARIEASVDEETFKILYLKRLKDGHVREKNSVPYIVTSELQTRQLDVTKMSTLSADGASTFSGCKK